MTKEIILDIDEVIALEKDIEESGTPLFELMKRAGNALALEAISELEKRGRKGRVAVLCGNGNNGGDGWVAAKMLANHNINSCVISAVEPSDITAMPAKLAVDSACNKPSSLLRVYVDPECSEVLKEIREADIVIDAILGTGFHYDRVREPYRLWIDSLNIASEKSRAYVISCDVPSGMNANTGEVADICVKANKTVTMMCNKTGLAMPNSKQYTGDIVVAKIAEIEKFL